MGKKYKNPPVVEALCEIFFIGSKWDGTVPGMFFHRIKADYPKKKEIDHIGVEVSISPEIQNTKTVRGGQRIQFIKEDNSQMVQIEKDLLVVNQLRPYPKFENWKPTIDRMLKVYGELAQPAGIKQIGIRYINRVVIPSSSFKREDYFKLYPQVPSDLAEGHGKFMLRLEIPPKHKGHQLVITYGTTPADSPETSAEMLDLYDTYSAFNPLPLDGNKDCIIKAYENIEAAFENAITQKLRDLFEEE